MSEDNTGANRSCQRVGDDEGMGDYRPPTSPRRLAKPMSVSRALWSSTVPEETFSDMRRFKYGAHYAVKKSSSEDVGYNISNAESI